MTLMLVFVNWFAEKAMRSKYPISFAAICLKVDWLLYRESRELPTCFVTLHLNGACLTLSSTLRILGGESERVGESIPEFEGNFDAVWVVPGH